MSMGEPIIQALHSKAMELADVAFIARSTGDNAKAAKLFADAFISEKSAATLAVESKIPEPSLSILLRSAAILALDCGNLREAEKLTSLALAGDPPDSIADELREIYETIKARKNLALQALPRQNTLFELFKKIRASQSSEVDSSVHAFYANFMGRLTHEIRNSLVPLATYAQLFDSDYGDAEFRDSLKHALSCETSRIQRLTEQLLLLARNDPLSAESVPLNAVLHAAFAKSREIARGAAELELKSDLSPVSVRANRFHLMSAFEEIFLNGIQSAGVSPLLEVRLRAAIGPEGRPEVAVSVRDSGTGFDFESAAHATEPFFTTRRDGLGLGLFLASRVIKAHQGRLEVRRRTVPTDPDVIVHLPIFN